MPFVIAYYSHEYYQSILYVWRGCYHIHSNTLKNQKNYMRHTLYNSEWSMEQEENKHKTNSTGKVKDGIWEGGKHKNQT